ncbi:MAG: glycosyl hydrolase 53 family protein [Clostridiales bacterium]|nr:glycosyl hydrolase 53 family protein [Clostridiales bacterium]
MKTMKYFLLAALALGFVFTLCGCGAKIPKKAENCGIYVEKVENLPKDFIMGMDASSVIAEEESGVKYYGFDGEEQDVFKTLAESGINYIRVRVWNNPFDENGNGYGGGNNDIDRAVEIGKRATKYGMKLLVDFHYSDFWADPSKQMVPLAWKGMDIETKTEAVYEYTKECLEKLKAAKVNVGMVQIGNETNGSMCGEKIWFNIQYLMGAGSKAVREVFPKALVAVHFANPEKVSNYADYAKKLDYYSLDYDVFGSSYYPYWHGTLDNLSNVLSNIAETYGKKVMVLETSYAYTAEDTDFNGNTISDGGTIVKDYPFTVQGQATSVRNIIDTIANKTTNGIGVVYWEGTWISVGGESWEENSEKWEKYGSGWATSYSSKYDPNDAGKYYGGCAVENQAMFDEHGKPLDSLRVFGLVRYGNDVPLAPDALEDVTMIVDLNGEIKLPETVNAVMNDGSKQKVPVVWEITGADYEKMYSGGVAKYDISGKAGDMTAHCYVSMVEYNFLENYSFESGDLTGWKLTQLGKADELYVENKASDSLTGTYHMHFWSAAQNSVEFSLEQTAKDIKTGKYKFTVSIMGGDAGETDIYAYVKIDGETVGTAPMKITSYNEWDTAVITDISYTEGQTLTVGVYVKCQGAGNGAWGKIDDALLNSIAE